MSNQILTKGRVVRYVSHGTPVRPDGTQAYEPSVRPAIVTEVGDHQVAGLMIVNPTGLFFHPLTDGGVPYDEMLRPGTWHWPPREDGEPAELALPSPFGEGLA